MSLAQLAQHIQSQGRGDDKLLVHMTPKEVGGLQSLAMAHGGSLTINPTTGLPEAGFLSNILPTIIGAGVGIATMNPMLGAAAGGTAGMAMNDGSLKAGLMAGLSSYGFGSLGTSLAEAGATALGAEGAGMLGSAMEAGALNPALIESGTSGMAGAAMEAGALNPAMVESGVSAATSAPSTWDNIRAGIGAINEQPGGWGQFIKGNMMPVGAAGMGLLGAMDSSQSQGTDNQTSPGYIRPYKVETTINPSAYTPGTPYMTRTSTPEEPVPADEWGSRSFAKGGVARYADGGIGSLPNPYAPNFAQLNPAMGIIPAPDYLSAANNPSNPFGVAFNPYVPMGYQTYGQNRYGPPTAQTNMPIVGQYNQALADQSNLEYLGQPTLAAFLSQQQKELQRAYEDILGRAPDAGSQKKYLEQMDRGATIDEIKKQMQENPPPVPAIDPTIDVTKNQNPYPVNLPVVQTPYGQPGAIEQSAAINRAAATQTGIPSGGQTTTPVEPVVAPEVVAPVKEQPEIDPEWEQKQRELAAQAQAEREAAAKAAADTAAAEKAKEPEQPAYDFDQYQRDLTQALGWNPYGEWSRGHGGGGAAAGGLMHSYGSGGGIGSLPRYNLGGYSDGGRLLRGPGDGVSDNIPAVIGDKQPARLADGEFVVPARIVSELGNGSTDAGAKRLYQMMDRIQNARKKSVGKGKVAVDSKAYKHLPK